MRPTKTNIAFGVFLFLFLPFFLLAQEKYSKVKIYVPKDREKRAEVIGLLDIDHFVTSSDGAIISEINQKDILKLRSTPYRFEVLVPDVAKRLDSLNRIYYRSMAKNRVAIEQPGSPVSSIIQTPAAFQVKATFGGYYSYAEMVTAMDNLISTYPTIAQKINIGTTVEGRTLWLIKISDNVVSDEASEPEVLYLGLQHAREAITGSSMIFFMQYLCDRYAANDTRIVNLVNNREIYIVPCFNPDGWEYNRNNGGVGSMWRKNRKPNGGGIYGVDLNRNWGVDWANCSAPISGPASSCGSNTTSSDTYWGASAFSEFETQAIRNFVKQHHVVAGFDQHSYGPYYSLPFGRFELHTMPVKGQNFYTAIPALMGTYNGMRAANSYDALGYEVAGGFKDWMLMGELGSSIGSGLKDTVWAMTGEGAAGGGTSGNDFWAPASQIINLCKGMCYQNLQLAFAAGTYVDITDATDMALISKSGNFTTSVKRIGIGNDPVTIALVPLENIQSVGAPYTINSMNYYDTINVNIAYSLPATLTNGQRIKFAWQVSTGGYTYFDTVVKFYNPTSLLYDDMEGTLGTNWTNTATNVASGFGYTYTAANWVFTTGGYKSAQALSESANGTNYTGSSIRTIQYKNTFDLSNATAAYLSFWSRYRAENFRDKVQVQVSTNGTAWVPIRGTHTVEEPGTLDDATINGQPALTGIHDYWMRESFDLSAYTGTGNTAIRLRFVFTSDNDPSSFAFERDEGFFIDNLSVMKSTVPLVTLPVNFLDFTATLLSDNTVKLNWQAVTDQDHDYFVVERSADGKNFITLSLAPQSAPYSYIDAAPLQGKNYYRIKQMNKNGSFTYSKVMSIMVVKGNNISLYPNPVADMLSIKLKNSERDRLKIEITNVDGKTVYNKTNFVNENTVELQIDMTSWKAQIYVLRVSNSKGELIATKKLIKL